MYLKCIRLPSDLFPLVYNVFVCAVVISVRNIHTCKRIYVFNLIHTKNPYFNATSHGHLFCTNCMCYLRFFKMYSITFWPAFICGHVFCMCSWSCYNRNNTQWINQTVNQLNSESIKQWINQTVNQSNSESIKQWIN